MKVTKYNRVYEVSEKEIEKEISIRADLLEFNKNGVYTGSVAGEALTKEDIKKEIEALEQTIGKLKERDNDTIAFILIWTEEDEEDVRKWLKELGHADLFEDEEVCFSKPIE